MPIPTVPTRITLVLDANSILLLAFSLRCALSAHSESVRSTPAILQELTTLYTLLQESAWPLDLTSRPHDPPRLMISPPEM